MRKALPYRALGDNATPRECRNAMRGSGDFLKIRSLGGLARFHDVGCGHQHLFKRGACNLGVMKLLLQSSCFGRLRLYNKSVYAYLE